MKFSFYLVIFLLIIFSCQKEIKFDIQYPESKPTVNCIVNPDSIIKLYLSESLTPVDIINFNSIEDAYPEVYKYGNFLGLLNMYVKPTTNPGLAYYTSSNISFNSDDSLEIIILHEDFNTITAKTSIPKKPVADIEIISYSFKKILNSISNGYSIDAVIKISISDNKLKKKNYYSVKMYYDANDLPYPNNTDTLYKDIIHYTQNRGNMIKTYKFNEGFIFSNDIFENDTLTFYMYAEDQMYIKTPDLFKLYVEVKSISEDFYRYQKSLKEYYQALGNPFSEPAKVYGNINNGYGIFAGYNSIIDTVFLQLNQK